MWNTDCIKSGDRASNILDSFMDDGTRAVLANAMAAWRDGDHVSLVVRAQADGTVRHSHRLELCIITSSAWFVAAINIRSDQYSFARTKQQLTCLHMWKLCNGLPDYVSAARDSLQPVGKMQTLITKQMNNRRVDEGFI